MASAERLRDLTSQWQINRRDLLGGFCNLYNPHVLWEPGAEFPFKMWLFGWAAADDNSGHPGSDAIFFARGKDLEHWEVYSGADGWDRTKSPARWVPVLAADQKPFDNIHNGDPSVVHKDGKYYMALSSVGFDTRQGPGGPAIYVISCVLGAVSSDGIHWEKSKAPILIWKDEYRRGWPLKDGKIGPPPDDYYGSYHRPSLLHDNGRWRLWFDYFHPGTFVSLGCAENRGDFLNPADWQVVRAEDKPLLKDWPNPAVVKVRDHYFSFSDAPYYPARLGGDGRQITMAESSDGLDWRILGHLRPEGEASSHVPETFVCHAPDGDWLYLFYSWKPARAPSSPGDFRYKAIRFMRQKIDSLPNGAR